MKVRLSNSLATLLLSACVFSASSVLTHAASSNQGERALQIINSEGFRTCKSLGNSGYTATASGLLIGGSGRGSGRFRLRTCFQTQRECEAFLDRIPNIVGKIDIIRHRQCKPR